MKENIKSFFEGLLNLGGTIFGDSESGKQGFFLVVFYVVLLIVFLVVFEFDLSSGLFIVIIVFNFFVVAFRLYRFVFHIKESILTEIEGFSSIFMKLESDRVKKELESNNIDFQIVGKLSKVDLLNEIINGVVLRYHSKTKLVMDEILAENITPFFNNMQTKFSNAAGFSIAIGLLGTFLGMMGAIDKDSLSTSNLIDSLSLAIGTSIAGVGSAIFIMSLNKLYSLEEMLLRKKIIQFILGKLYPNFQTETILTIDDRAAGIIGDKIKEALTDAFNQVFGNLTSAMEKLTYELTELGSQLHKQNQLLNAVVSDLRDMVENWSVVIQEMHLEFVKIEETMGAFNKEMNQNKIILESANDQLIQNLERFNNAAKILESDLEQWAIKNPVLSIQENVDAIENSVNGLTGIVTNLDETLGDSMKDFIEKAAAYWQPMENTTRAHTVSLDNLVNELKTIKQSLSSINNSMGNTEKKLTKITATEEEARGKSIMGRISKFFNN